MIEKGKGNIQEKTVVIFMTFIRSCVTLFVELRATIAALKYSAQEIEHYATPLKHERNGYCFVFWPLVFV